MASSSSNSSGFYVDVNEEPPLHTRSPTPANNNAITASSRKRKHSTYHMYDHIEEMMYGFGDKWPPNTDSVELVERIVANYVRNLCHRAKDIADVTGTLDKECFLYAVRKDRRKFTRIYTLLKVHEEIKKAAKTEELPIDANQDFPPPPGKK